ncbi:hypothetical protein [Coleofasciculus sp. E2-BRE-01]|jgi:hypothetical protein|uniref:hypothetical protein n=1 Tax=unclassified Coleofasciculus TaxID=2692782 RepID=UPI0033030255
MRTLETTVNVTSDGKITLQLPPDIPAGEYQVVLVLDQTIVPEASETPKKRPPLNFPVDSYGSWSPNLSLRREDMYDEWGR